MAWMLSWISVVEFCQEGNSNFVPLWSSGYKIPNSKYLQLSIIALDYNNHQYREEGIVVRQSNSKNKILETFTDRTHTLQLGFFKVIYPQVILHENTTQIQYRLPSGKFCAIIRTTDLE